MIEGWFFLKKYFGKENKEAKRAIKKEKREIHLVPLMQAIHHDMREKHTSIFGDMSHPHVASHQPKGVPTMLETPSSTISHSVLSTMSVAPVVNAPHPSPPTDTSSGTEEYQESEEGGMIATPLYDEPHMESHARKRYHSTNTQKKTGSSQSI
jgi:hypothetical protein